MSVSNGQKANAATFNNAFQSKTANNTSTGIQNLANTSDEDSGPAVSNVQRAINEIFDAEGMSGVGDAGRKDYSSQNYVANGDNKKTAIGKLDAAIKNLADQINLAQGVELKVAVGNGDTDIEITDLIFPPDVYLSFEFTWTVFRKSTGTGATIRQQRGSFIGVSDGSTWVEVSPGQVAGSDAGVEFDYDASTGQWRFTADTQSGDYDADTSWISIYIRELANA